MLKYQLNAMAEKRLLNELDIIKFLKKMRKLVLMQKLVVSQRHRRLLKYSTKGLIEVKQQSENERPWLKFLRSMKDFQTVVGSSMTSKFDMKLLKLIVSQEELKDLQESILEQAKEQGLNFNVKMNADGQISGISNPGISFQD